MKKLVFIVLIVFVVILMYFGITYYLDNNTGNEDVIEINIKKGENILDVASILKNKEVIKSKSLFLLYGIKSGSYKDIKFGKHLLLDNMNYKEIYNNLKNEAVFEDKRPSVRITIQEGYNIRQIAEKLEANNLINKDRFLELSKEGDVFSYWFLEDIPKIDDELFYKLEGFLYPDTYDFYVDSTEEEIINKMLDRFDVVFSEYKDDVENVYDIIKMASLIEREVQVDEERDLVSGVFYNRLDVDMKLQSCATVQFLFGKPKERILYKDLEIKSPYNTYLNNGLPIGAISNFGESSLKAAIYPKDTEYLYFVVSSENNGSHVFAKTLSEHNKNAKKYKDSRFSD